MISSIERSVSSKCCVRDRIVGSTFSGFVVASTNTTWPGGSSSVFSNAFDAAVLSMCTSSTRYTFDLRRRAEAEADPLDEVADRVDAVVRRGVHLDEVVEVAGRDRDAVLALAARLAVGAEVQAVERLGEDAAGRGLARAAGSGEQVGVADAPFAHGVAQRRGDVLLADQLAETLRSVLAVEGLEGHRPTLPATLGALEMRTVHPLSTRHRRARSPLPAQTRPPCGTREGPLRAASFRT